MTLRLVSVDEVMELHAELLERHGGHAGIRDRGLLESAVAAAANEVAYGTGELFDVAAAYVFHIAENQPFLDGNKRAAVAAALCFLQWHRVVCDLTADEI